MPDCPACTQAATSPHSGLYHADCAACQGRMFDQTVPLHLNNLKTIPASKDRTEYIAVVERKHGKDAAEKIKRAYLEWWNARRKAKAL